MKRYFTDKTFSLPTMTGNKNKMFQQLLLERSVSSIKE